MNTRAVFFPFDLFGSPGTRAGAELLADAFEELLADNRRERVATRARAYTEQVRVEEFTFASLDDYRDWRESGRKCIRGILERGDFLLWIAGNHLGALPLYDELAGERTLVIQLDAHLDIFNLRDCTRELSHGNFLLHAEKPLPRIVNVGHRELLLRPDYIKKHYHASIPAALLATDGAAAIATLRELIAGADRIFVDVDCDVFDPTFFPAVHDARPFGLEPRWLLTLLDLIGPARLAGLAISEFEPGRDSDARCLETLMWLIEYVLLLKHES
ncbi:MAG TPA: arginase family protein [Gemmataceae bacterium]|nr:arginase family protein [Gemmataceae bacterium]